MNKIETIKKLIREVKCEAVRIINVNDCQILPRYSLESKTSTCGGKEYFIEFSYVRGSLSETTKNEIKQKLLDVVGMNNIMCYKISTNTITRHLGSRYWSPVKDTGRDKLELTILSTEDRTNDAKPLVDIRSKWVFLKPELLEILRVQGC